MDPQTIVAIVAIPVAIIGSYITARISRKKEPEDRDSIIAETTERVVKIVTGQLEQALATLERCEKVRADLEGHIKRANNRITRLEREVHRLGGDPSKINGGGE